MPGFGELESPTFGSPPNYTGSPKLSQETITCDSEGKVGQDNFIKGQYKEKRLLLSVEDKKKLKINGMLTANGTVSHFGHLSDDALSLSDSMSHSFSPEVENALLGVQFIAQHIRDNDKDNEVNLIFV